MMERKTRYEVQELLVAEYETDGSMNLLLAKVWTLSDKIKGTVRPEKLEFDEALQATLQSSYRGEYFWWVRSRRISYEKDLQKCKLTELVIKQEVHWQFSSDVSKEALRICKTMAAIWKHSLYFSEADNEKRTKTAVPSCHGRRWL